MLIQLEDVNDEMMKSGVGQVGYSKKNQEHDETVNQT